MINIIYSIQVGYYYDSKYVYVCVNSNYINSKYI